MTGAAYDGGGIASTVAATRDASDDTLRALLRGRIAEMHAQGTGIVEVKSGYGLDVTTETRLLRLAREVTDGDLPRGPFVPPEYRFRRDEYVDLVTGPMLAEARAYALGRRVLRAEQPFNNWETSPAPFCSPARRPG